MGLESGAPEVQHFQGKLSGNGNADEAGLGSDMSRAPNRPSTHLWRCSFLPTDTRSMCEVIRGQFAA